MSRTYRNFPYNGYNWRYKYKRIQNFKHHLNTLEDYWKLPIPSYDESIIYDDYDYPDVDDELYFQHRNIKYDKYDEKYFMDDSFDSEAVTAFNKVRNIIIQSIGLSIFDIISKLEKHKEYASSWMINFKNPHKSKLTRGFYLDDDYIIQSTNKDLHDMLKFEKVKYRFNQRDQYDSEVECFLNQEQTNFYLNKDTTELQKNDFYTECIDAAKKYMENSNYKNCSFYAYNTDVDSGFLFEYQTIWDEQNENCNY